MAEGWDAQAREAMKILGEKGKIPKVNPAVLKARTSQDKTFDAFDKSRDDLKAKLLAVQNSVEALKDGLSQLQDEIDESNLGLDPKSKDDAQKIADAKKVLSGWLDDQMKTCDLNFKNLKELDRHLMSLMNYKQGA